MVESRALCLPDVLHLRLWAPLEYRLVPIEVCCFGEQDVTEPNLRVKGYPTWPDAKQNTDPRFG
jgi:hypothetical protein